MTRPPKDFGYWKTTLLRDWPSRLVLTVLIGFAGLVWAQGKTVVKAEGGKIAIEAVKPTLDSFKVQVDTLKGQVKQLQGQVQDLQEGQEKQGRIQQEFFGAMMDAIPGLKKSVQDRGKQNADVVNKKAETEKLLDNLTEKKP